MQEDDTVSKLGDHVKHGMRDECRDCYMMNIWRLQKQATSADITWVKAARVISTDPSYAMTIRTEDLERQEKTQWRR